MKNLQFSQIAHITYGLQIICNLYERNIKLNRCNKTNYNHSVDGVFPVLN